MATNDSIKTIKGKNIMLRRAYTETVNLTSTEWTVSSQFKTGINEGTPATTQTDLTNAIPISHGSPNDGGDNNFVGTNGGDNSTDNTTTYKEGAGLVDATSQNMIANDTSVTKTWTIADLTVAGANTDPTKYIGLWFYILDSTTLDKFKTSGTCLRVKSGTDSSNYLYKDYEVSDLAVGWNWLSENVLLSTWTTVGTVTTYIWFEIEVTTNNATDVFIAGDVIYDLLRQWQLTDFFKNYVSGYPAINDANLEVTSRCYLTSTEANGFLLNTFATFNTDTNVLMDGKDRFTATSKSSTDEIIFVAVDRII